MNQLNSQSSPEPGDNLAVFVPEPGPVPDGVETLLHEPWDTPVDKSKFKQKRTREQREEDLIIVAQMHTAHKSAEATAKYLSTIRPYTLSREQIRYDLREVENRWSEKRTQPFLRLRNNELANIERLELEAFEAWEASKTEQITMRMETTPKGGGGNESVLKKIVERTKRHGDPAMLAILVRLHERRCKLLGLEAPTKTEVEVNGTIEEKFNLEKLRQNFRRKIEMDIIEQRRIETPDAQTPAVSDA